MAGTGVRCRHAPDPVLGVVVVAWRAYVDGPDLVQSLPAAKRCQDDTPRSFSGILTLAAGEATNSSRSR